MVAEGRGGRLLACNKRVLVLYERMIKVSLFWPPKGEGEVQPIATNIKTDLRVCGGGVKTENIR